MQGGDTGWVNAFVDSLVEANEGSRCSGTKKVVLGTASGAQAAKVALRLEVPGRMNKPFQSKVPHLAKFFSVPPGSVGCQSRQVTLFGRWSRQSQRVGFDFIISERCNLDSIPRTMLFQQREHGVFIGYGFSVNGDDDITDDLDGRWRELGGENSMVAGG